MCMMGVPIYGPAYVYGDNILFIHIQRIKLILKRKSNSIYYHTVRESVTMGEITTSHASALDNCAELATNLLLGGLKLTCLISNFLYDIAD